MLRASDGKPGAMRALVILTLINLLNYVDRYVPSATKTDFQKDLGLNDFQSSVPLTAFVVVYMCASPVFGYLADRDWSRPGLICFGVLVWSVATACAALATDFWTLVIPRACVGIGEAAYATIAPALLSDFYASGYRNKVLSFFYLAIPVGGAIGFGVGSGLAAAFGWRVAFVAVGAPGVLIAFITLTIKEPVRGALDAPDVVHSNSTSTGGESKNQPTVWQAVVVLFKNKEYLFAVFGMTMVAFASGGMADWLPTYLQKRHGMEESMAGTVIGAMTIVGGIGGTLSGSWLAEKMTDRVDNPYFYVCAMSMIPTVAAAILAIAIPNMHTCLFFFFVAQFFLWMYTGPANAIIANCTAPIMRSQAFAISIFLTHALGDAISPPIVGAISDASTLQTAVSILPVTLFFAGVIWAVGFNTVVSSVPLLSGQQDVEGAMELRKNSLSAITVSTASRKSIHSVF
eukprot:GILJ01011175.1.p1 GENE.GILJ01011175.1~~GILJ01011175.1.p1  ORF type:complete len:459 (+),score=58.33 GILJ01011175.1:120-1496(+)